MATPSRTHTRHRTVVRLVQGDITSRSVDAIVNAADPELSGGGGVDRAIHVAAGPEMRAACDAWLAEHGALATGEAITTAAGDLAASTVVHTVGPVFQDGQHSEYVLLERAWRNSLAAAMGAGARSVALPSISTGTFRFPVAEAALVALNTMFRFVDAHPDALDLVEVVLFSASDLAAWEARLDEVVETMLGTPASG